MADSLVPPIPPPDMYAVHGLKRLRPDYIRSSRALIARAANMPPNWLEAREDMLKEVVAYAGSQIEIEMLHALLTETDGLPTLIRPGNAFKFTELEMAPRLIVAPQHWIGDMRVDIAVQWTGTGVKAVVECDGYEFHEKAVEQVNSDNERDQAAQERGWKVSRHTGAAIYADPLLCSRKVMRLLTAKGGAE